jgi:UDP-N-acetylmuramyl pentapeptide phosphotransferase/UDP-N-acetylglucosamine-1-phosphate transferase
VTDGLSWAPWFGVAGVAAAVLTSRIVRWAGARGVIDRPNHRSSHVQATPRGGGLAIVAITVLAALLAGWQDPAAAARLAGAIVPALAVAVVSWIDDVRSLPTSVRLATHAAAAAAATVALQPIPSADLGSFGSLELGPAAWPLTLLWIVGLTNACNFMDGIDGIAGITAIAAGAGLAVVAGPLGGGGVAPVALAFSGAMVGFLWWNWQPARIFMGDVGSAFCGFLIAVLPMAMPPQAVPTAVPVAVLAMWPFIFDTLLTLGRRIRRGENILQAHRSHLYQRLVIAGWSHRSVALLYGLLAAAGAVLAVIPIMNPSLASAIEPLALAFVPGSAAILLALTTRAERCLSSTTAI